MSPGFSTGALLFYSVICCLLTVPAYGHVRITYPPARKFALDFLDVVRTPPPCGMPKGLGPITNFLANEEITVTWHVAYPHRGGFALNLLAANESVIHRFTNGFISTTDPTKLSYNIIIPNLECMNCSIQLVRQAGEWSTSCNNGKYDFYSCADINIKTGGLSYILKCIMITKITVNLCCVQKKYQCAIESRDRSLRSAMLLPQLDSTFVI